MKLAGTETPTFPVGPNSPPHVAPDPMQWLKDITAVAGSALTLINQQKLADTNMKRAAMNLPPISAEAAGAIPTATVNMGIDTKTRDLVMWGGIGMLAIFGASALMKKRR